MRACSQSTSKIQFLNNNCAHFFRTNVLRRHKFQLHTFTLSISLRKPASKQLLRMPWALSGPLLGPDLHEQLNSWDCNNVLSWECIMHCMLGRTEASTGWFELSGVRVTENYSKWLTEIQGKSILVLRAARFQLATGGLELSGVNCKSVFVFRNCKSYVYNCDDLLLYNSSPHSSHISFSYNKNRHIRT